MRTRAATTYCTSDTTPITGCTKPNSDWRAAAATTCSFKPGTASGDRADTGFELSNNSTPSSSHRGDITPISGKTAIESSRPCVAQNRNANSSVKKTCPQTSEYKPGAALSATRHTTQTTLSKTPIRVTAPFTLC